MTEANVLETMIADTGRNEAKAMFRQGKRVRRAVRETSHHRQRVRHWSPYIPRMYFGEARE